jgi:hypothetical protein
MTPFGLIEPSRRVPDGIMNWRGGLVVYENGSQRIGEFEGTGYTIRPTSDSYRLSNWDIGWSARHQRGPGGDLRTCGLLEFSQHRAHATSLAAIPLFALIGAIIFSSTGNVNLVASIFLVMGSFVGVAGASRIMVRMNEVVLRRAFGLLMLAVGIRLLLRGGLSSFGCCLRRTRTSL